MSYEELKRKYPLLNWTEAEDTNNENLSAACAYFDRLKDKPSLKHLHENLVKQYADRH